MTEFENLPRLSSGAQRMRRCRERRKRGLSCITRGLLDPRVADARWSRDAEVPTICRCILGTFKYEPRVVETAVLRRAIEGVIEHTARGGTLQKGEDSDPKREGLV